MHVAPVDVFKCLTVHSSLQGTEPPLYAADAAWLPFAGSLFAGFMAAFLLICVLLSVYTSYMAMPEGSSSWVLLDPRGLMVTNGLVVFSSTYAVEKQFAYCISDAAASASLFALYCILACWLDAVVDLVQDRFFPPSSGNDKRIFQVARYSLMQGMALVPLIGLLITHPVYIPSIVLVSATE